jgi:hypothetical protein
MNELEQPQPTDQTQPSEHTDPQDPREAQALEGLRGNIELRPDYWSSMDNDQRQVALQSAENRMAQAYGRPPQEVLTDKPDGSTWNAGECGQYDPEHKAISMNPDRFEDPREAVDTLAHEGRHAYQHHVCDENNLGTHPDHIEAGAWGDNIRNYVSPDKDFEGYWNQPIERDARDFGQRMTNGLYGEAPDAE